MALTKHEKFHLDHVVAETEDNKNQSVITKGKLADAKGQPLLTYNSYLDTVKADAQKILDSGKFPAGLLPCHIHDYLEK